MFVRDSFVQERYGLDDCGMLNWTHQPEYVDAFRKLFAQFEATRILEIGTYAGVSCIGFLELLPRAQVVVVDSWQPYGQRPDDDYSRIEAVFEENVSRAGARERVTKIKGFSQLVLPALARAGYSFDIVYIDGDHRCLSVAADSFLAWQVLRIKGLLLWDDYLWNGGPGPLSKPKAAIDYFLEVHAGRY